MNNYEDQILDTVEKIINNTLDQSSYDKTIQATIQKITNLSSATYLLKYQDSSFEAASADKNVTFAKDDLVYVLVPNGDMRKDKTIIGKVGGTAIRNANVYSSKDTFVKIGKVLNNEINNFSLCSYKAEQQIKLYENDGNNLIDFDKETLKEYQSSGDVFTLEFSLKTNLNREQRSKGDYGIKIRAYFKSADDQESILKTLTFNINDISGNPYNITTSSTQIKIFEEDIANLDYIYDITLFQKSFPNQKDNQEDDLFFSNICFYVGKQLTEEELNSSRIDLTTPQGSVFNLEDSQKTEKTILATVKINGKDISKEELNKCEFYWFKENSLITINNEKYNLYGGEGWECLNDYNLVTEEDKTTFVAWTSAKNTLTRTKSQIIAKEENYKCVCIYQNEILQNSIILKNYNADYTISIECDKETQFYYKDLHPSLTCKINGEEQVSADYSYIWGTTNNEGNFEILEETEDLRNNYNQAVSILEETLKDIQENGSTELKEEQIQKYQEQIKNWINQIVYKNQVSFISIAGITDYSIYKCSVYYKNNYIGTASYTIYNRLLEDLQNYILKINNADIIYKYDEEGVTPTLEGKENITEITPLSFSLYNSKGEEISENMYSNCEIEWIPPTENTLIIADTILNQRTLSFSLEEQYSNQKTNNLIQLKVNLKGETFWATANLNIIKEGDIGTNGTQYICKIVPNTTDSIDLPIITNGELNYVPATSGKWFKLQLWKNGKKIFEDTESGLSDEKLRVTVQWSILKNKYTARYSDPSSLSCSLGIFTFDDFFEEDENGCDSPANLIKCTVTYEEKKYYAVIPVITIKNNYSSIYTIDFNKSSGFLNVQYASDGTNPQFKDYPFEIDVKGIIDGYTTDISQSTKIGVNYLWEVCGQVYNIETKQWEDCSNLEIGDSENLARNQKYYIPVKTYNGECVTTGLRCHLSRLDKDEEIGQIHIPIYFYLNRYSNSALNEWDGNKITIDEENGSYILTPQAGAGRKENDNTFTGMLMGVVKDATNEVEKTGLLGYNKGQQSLFLDAETGGAIFGKTGKGQILIDPNSDKSLLYSHNYWKSTNYDSKGFPISTDDSNTDNITGEGLLIDLSTPTIKYGDGSKFKVDKDGNVTCGTMITSKGVLTLITAHNSGVIGMTITQKDATMISKTITSTIGSYTDTYEALFPDSVSIIPKSVILQCFLPPGFEVRKAYIVIESYAYYPLIYLPDYYQYAETSSNLPSGWTEEKESYYITSSSARATDNIGLYFTEADAIYNIYAQVYEGWSYDSEIDQSKLVLLKKTSGFEKNSNDATQRKIIDFTEQAKQYLVPGDINYLVLQTARSKTTKTLTPLSSATQSYTYGSATRTYNTYKFSTSLVNIRATELMKNGNTNASIYIYGYYDPAAEG